MLRPTIQARKGFDPNGIGPGLSAPFGYSRFYSGMHHGQDYFWLSAGSAGALGMTQAQSFQVFAVVNGPVNHVNSAGLGTGLWQQIDGAHRAYYWHLVSRSVNNGQTVGTDTQIGVMGHTGTAAGNATHLHFEVRAYPYGDGNRIDPEPFFNNNSPSGGGSEPFMALDNNDKDWMRLMVRQEIQAAIMYPGAGFTYFQHIVNQNNSIGAAIDELPTNGEMGQALTSTVALVNEHADSNKQEILDAIDDIPGGSGGGSSAVYSLSIDVPAVPGTATGTATPQ